MGFENVATNVKGKRKTSHILLEIAVKKPPKFSKQSYYHGVKMCLKRKCSSFNNGGFNFSPFMNNVWSGNHLESGYYPLEDVKKMAIIPRKIEWNIAMNQLWGTNYMSLIIPINLATQWKSNIKIWHFLRGPRGRGGS